MSAAATQNEARVLAKKVEPPLAPRPNVERIDWEGLLPTQIYLLAEIAYDLLTAKDYPDQWARIIESLLRIPGWLSTNHRASGLDGEWVFRLNGAEIFYQGTKAEVDTDGRDNGLVEQGDRNYCADNPFKLRVGVNPVNVTIYNLTGAGGHLLNPYARDKQGGRPDFVAYEQQADALRREADHGRARPAHFRVVEVPSGELVPGSYRDHGITANIVAVGQRWESMPLGRLGLILNPRNRLVRGLQVHDAKGKVGRAGEFSYGTIDALNPTGVEGSNRNFSASSSPFDSSRSYGTMLWSGSESVYGSYVGTGRSRYFTVLQLVDDDIDAISRNQGTVRVQQIIQFILNKLVLVEGVRPSFQLLAVRRYARTGSLYPSITAGQDTDSDPLVAGQVERATAG